MGTEWLAAIEPSEKREGMQGLQAEIANKLYWQIDALRNDPRAWEKLLNERSVYLFCYLTKKQPRGDEMHRVSMQDYLGLPYWVGVDIGRTGAAVPTGKFLFRFTSADWLNPRNEIVIQELHTAAGRLLRLLLCYAFDKICKES